MGNPNNLIKVNKYTHTLETPTIILKHRNLDVIGEIKHFTNWTISFQATEVDEISFDIYRELNGEKCDIWENIIDHAIIEVLGYGHFEIGINIDESNETIKNVIGQSLEVELGQLVLHDFYVNDFEEERIEQTEYNVQDFDNNGNLIPTVFYNEEDIRHSLLHRVLADKAPHWSIGYVPQFIAINNIDKPELVSDFQRTYTVDGTSIYDFLVNDVAKESNVIFVFDTYNRIINCYNAKDYIWTDPENSNNQIVINGIGDDTTILVDKENLANQITISGDKDSVKNCFRVSGGDDIITSRVAAVNMTGNNYIWMFSKQQMDDMSEQLQSVIKSYNNDILNNEEVQEEYYGNGKVTDFIDGSLTLHITSDMDAYKILSICKSNDIIVDKTISVQSYAKNPYWSVVIVNKHKTLKISSTVSNTVMRVQDAYNTMGIFSQLCVEYDLYYFLESEMMPNVILGETNASDQYMNVIHGFSSLPVGISSYSRYDDEIFVGITNNIEELAYVFLDPRYEIEIIKDSTSYNSVRHEWHGRIKIYRTTDKTDFRETAENSVITVNVVEGELEFTKQKILKALTKGDISSIDEEFEFDIEPTDTKSDIERKKNILQKEVYDYFYNNYCRVRLESFHDTYQSCLSILGDLSARNDSIVAEELQIKYAIITEELEKVLKQRTEEVAEINNHINNNDNGLLVQQKNFHNKIEFQNYIADTLGLGEDVAKKLYTEYCMYRRDDEYQNDNYISDGLSDSEITSKAKELLDVAKEEIKKSCVLQRSITTDLNNLLIIPEFEPLYDSFKLFNYIRVQTDDELFKLRLLNIKYDSNSPEKIDVTFAENIENVEADVDELKSMYDAVTSMATSYSSTVKQAKSGEKASNKFSELYNNGLNAALMKVTSSNNNDVTLGSYGLLCKEMLDGGNYSPNQVRLIGKGLYMTTDNWQTIRACLGETEDGVYGLIADSVVGKLIAGDKLYIANENGSVAITGNGINITNGTIKWENIDGLNDGINQALSNASLAEINAINYTNATKEELTVAYKNYTNSQVSDLDVKVAKYLSGGRSTIIGEKYMISPYIGGGYLNISSDNKRVIIDPKGLTGTNYIFQIHGNKSGENGIVLGVDSNGNATFNGTIEAVGGNIGGWNIDDYNIGKYDSSDDYFYIDSRNKSIYAKKDSRKIVLSAGSLIFYRDEQRYGHFSTAEWIANEGATNMYGIHMNSEYNSTYTSFGHRDENDAETFSSYLLLNYGLNPNGCTERVIMYGDARIIGDVRIHGEIYYGNSTNGMYSEKGHKHSSLERSGSEVGISSNDNFIPIESPYMNCGSSVNPWNKVFAEGGIGTSDERYKEVVGNISDDKRYDILFMNLKPRLYKFKNFTERDNHDRIHSGYISQEVKQAMEIANIDNTEFAAFCYSNFETDNINIINGLSEEESRKEIIKKNHGFKDKYMLGYTEFIALNTHMIQKLYKENEQLKQEIKTIKDAITKM